MSETISSLSTEYVRTPVTAKEAGADVDPTALTVEMAFLETGEPAVDDWNSASWETEDDTHYARCLVGPDGTVTLADGAYRVWVRIASAPETPVLYVGRLIVE